MNVSSSDLSLLGLHKESWQLVYQGGGLISPSFSQSLNSDHWLVVTVLTWLDGLSSCFFLFLFVAVVTLWKCVVCCMPEFDLVFSV